MRKLKRNVINATALCHTENESRTVDTVGKGDAGTI